MTSHDQQRDEDIEQYKRIGKMETAIQFLEEQISEQKSKAVRLEEILAKRDQQILTLGQRLRDEELQFSEKVMKMDSTIDGLEAQLVTEKSRVAQFQEHLATRNAQMTNLLDLLIRQNELAMVHNTSRAQESAQEPTWAAPLREIMTTFCETLMAITPRAVGFAPASPQKS